MKKLFAFALVVMLLFSLSACDKYLVEAQTTQVSTTNPTGNNSHTAENNKENNPEKQPYSGREMYEFVISAFLEIDDELSRGWFDQDAQDFVRFIKGDNVPAGASAMDLADIYDGFDDALPYTKYSIRDFFTVTSSNESTNAGVYNFFEAIDQMEAKKFNGLDVVKINQNGAVTGFNFSLAGGDAAIAKALGVSEEFVELMLHAATDAGFTVDFSE